jgi:hypothetical protein
MGSRHHRRDQQADHRHRLAARDGRQDQLRGEQIAELRTSPGWCWRSARRRARSLYDWNRLSISCRTVLRTAARREASFR